MKYAVIKGNKFTGTAYDEINEAIINHHTSQGELIVQVETAPEPIEYQNDMPVYGEVDFETLKQAKQFEISNKRYQAEVGGIEYNGAQIHTDRESQAKIQAAAMVALTKLTQGSLPADVQSLIALLPTRLDWKGKNEWLEADDETIIQLAFLVFTHVQQCYQRERQLQEQIEQATTIGELEAIVWDEQI